MKVMVKMHDILLTKFRPKTKKQACNNNTITREDICNLVLL